MSWDGKMYGKYRIEHTDGTPLNGKKYFVLRLDSDDLLEAARVAAAMRAYKREPRNCDIYLTEEAVDAAIVTVRDCEACPRIDMEAPCVFCMVRWLLAPATEKEGGVE